MPYSKWRDTIRLQTWQKSDDEKVGGIKGGPFGFLTALRKPDYELLRRYVDTKIPVLVFVGFLSVLSTILEALSLLLLILLLSIVVGEVPELENGINVLGIELSLLFLSNILDGEHAFVSVLLIAVGFKLASEAVRFLNSHFVQKVQVVFSYEIRTDLIKKVLGLNVSFFTDQKPGELAYMESTLTNRLTVFVTTLQMFFSSVLNSVVLLVLLIMLSPIMTMWLFFLGISLAVLVSRMGNRIAKDSLDLEKVGQAAHNIFLETMYGIRLIKQGKQELQSSTKYQNVEWDREVRTLKLHDYQAFNRCLAEMGGLAVLLFSAFGANLISGTDIFGKVSLGLGYLYVAMRAVKGVTNLQAVWMRLAVIVPQFKIMADFILDESYEEISAEQSRPSLRPIQRSLKVESLSFGYNAKRLVLNDVSLEFSAGTSTAIVGLSGSGKTTLVELMAGFRKGYNGQILVDGVDMGSHNLDSYRNQIGYVTQETIVLHDTLLNNIKFFNPDASIETVENVAKMSRVSDFIDDMEAGYETLMGERGFKVSGGQRQRIALARVLLQDPKVLILDEATSAVDLFTEALILNSLHKLTSDKIVIVVAHRLSSIAQFDNIIVVHKGKVVEQGTHVELLALRGLYQTLVSLQEFAPDNDLDALSKNIISS